MAIKRIESASRDGTSQSGRALAALDPGYVSVDERSPRDHLAFSLALGGALRYFDPTDHPAGSWAPFINPGGLQSAELSTYLDRIAAFLEEPSRFTPESFPELFRPHFTLFLAFLELLRRAQGELNTLTRRHLEFYYRRFLGLLNKGPIPDRVNLVLSLAARSNEVLVPRGTRLAAGPDSLGKERFYTTDRDIVVNRARVTRLRSLFVDRRLIGFPEIRQRAKPADLALAIWSLALGAPRPGDPLPVYPGGMTVTPATLSELDALTQATSETTGYFLSLGEIRDLVRLKETTAHLLGLRLTEQWRRVNDLLELGGRRKRNDPAYTLPAGFNPQAFTANAAAAIGTVTVPGAGTLGVEEYFKAVRELEAYFFMTAESYHQVHLQILAGAAAAGWERVDSLLDAAHEEKVRDGRRRRLLALHDADPAAGLDPLIQEVIGDASATEDDLLPFLSGTADLDQLRSAAQSDDWERAVSILEVAQSNRLGEPKAQFEEWINLHPAADATRVGVRRAPGEAPETPRWATFGLAMPEDPKSPPAPVIGLAVTGSLLSLSEGERTITLTLGLGGEALDPAVLSALFNPPPPKPGEEPAPLPFAFTISTDKGWIEPDSASVKLGAYSTLSGAAPALDDPQGLQIKLSFSAKAPALAPPDQAKSPWPVLRLMLRPVWDKARGQFVAPYPELGGLLLVSAHLQVSVAGMRAIKLQNEAGALDPKKPFLPFGSLPAVGSRLLIGHRELLSKRLDSLTFHLEWMGAPANLATHYTNYPDLPDPLGFTARISLVERSVATDLDPAAPLFTSNTSTAAGTWEIDGVAAPSGAGESFQGDDLLAWTRHLQCELGAPDFQHEAYPSVAAERALQLSVDIASQSVAAADTYKVKPPYTPKLKGLTADYTASLEIQKAGEAPAAGAARLLHIHPFGHCDAAADRTAAGVPLLPALQNDGELYIGLADVSPPQTVSLFFQMAEGTADPDRPPQPIQWSYLSGDIWVPLEGRVLLDTTRGLTSSGIVELGLLPAATSARLAGADYWVRASIARDPAVASDTIALHTQAASATFADSGNAPDHFRNPLPPGTITRLAAPIKGIAGVTQPYTSYGGRAAEADTMWATRAGERLRHKQRAVTVWDYERLVLERFPEVYKAKCVPPPPGRPGHVTVIVIPDIRDLLPSDPFEPKAPARLLSEIDDYLRSVAPAFVTVKAKNPRYVRVRVRLRVRFREEGNDGFYVRKLNEELNRFLSPWAYDDGADIVIGGKIYANSIIDFVDRRPYVDYVAGVRLFRSDDGERFTPAAEDHVGTDRPGNPPAPQPDAVLVASRTHSIDVLRDAVYEESLMTGIGFMKVELDFIVG